jgi:hypothetical protein
MQSFELKLEHLGQGVYQVEITGLDSFLLSNGNAGKVAVLQLFSDVTLRIVEASHTHFEAPESLQ